jgi:hypothetical protein
MFTVKSSPADHSSLASGITLIIVMLLAETEGGWEVMPLPSLFRIITAANRLRQTELAIGGRSGQAVCACWHVVRRGLALHCRLLCDAGFKASFF